MSSVGYCVRCQDYSGQSYAITGGKTWYMCPNCLREWTVVQGDAISYDEVPPTQRATATVVNHCHQCGRDARPSTCGAKLCSACGIWLSTCAGKCDSQHILSITDDGPPTDRMRRAS